MWTLPGLDGCARWLLRACRINHTLAQVSPSLLKIFGDTFDYIITAKLTVGLELAQIYQFRKRCIRLMFAHFIDLSLHLNLVTVVIHYLGVVFGVGIARFIQWVSLVWREATTDRFIRGKLAF